MDRLMEWVVKFLFFLILAPFVVCLALQLATGLMAAILPWLVLAAVVAGGVAGLSAGFVLRRWSVPRPAGGGLRSGERPARVDPIKRPRGLRGRKE